MASSSSSNALIIPCLAVAFFMLLSVSDARDFLFGTSKGNLWKIPSSPDEFNKWAERERFRIGDSIVVKYDSNSDSILQVSERDYISCNKANPIKTYNDGNSKIVLNDSGAFFFISGAEGHCERGQKLEVRVLSAKHGGVSPSHDHDFAPASSPMYFALAPAPAPTGAGYGLTVGFSSVALVIVSFVGLVMA